MRKLFANLLPLTIGICCLAETGITSTSAVAAIREWWLLINRYRPLTMTVMTIKLSWKSGTNYYDGLLDGIASTKRNRQWTSECSFHFYFTFIIRRVKVTRALYQPESKAIITRVLLEFIMSWKINVIYLRLSLRKSPSFSHHLQV